MSNVIEFDTLTTDGTLDGATIPASGGLASDVISLDGWAGASVLVQAESATPTSGTAGVTIVRDLDGTNYEAPGDGETGGTLRFGGGTKAQLRLKIEAEDHPLFKVHVANGTDGPLTVTVRTRRFRGADAPTA